MARNRGRSLPSTPDPRRASEPTPGPDETGAPASRPAGARRTAANRTPGSPSRTAPTGSEPDCLITGTGCVSGHERGAELVTSRLGKVPSRKMTRIGFGLVVWCLLGAAFLAKGRYAVLGLEIAALWLAFSAIVQRRAGQRWRGWRTRTWRHAWGGLVPVGQPKRT